MLLTGRQLARIVSRAMTEAPMREPEELIKHRHVVFYRRWDSFVGEFIEIAYYDRSQLHAYDPSAKHTMDPEGSEPVGRIKIIKPRRRHPYEPRCDETWNVDLTDQTRKG